MSEMINHVIAVKSVDIFKDIPYNLCLAICDIAELQEFAKGTQIIKKGDEGDCMYIILTGSVEVHDSGRRLAILEENEIFGELSLLAPVRRTENVIAIEDVLALCIQRAYFLELLVIERAIMDGILKVLIERIIDQNKKLAGLER